MEKNNIPELLAPAGSLDALKAAVNAGADAVYISGKKFGARKFANNFTNPELIEGLEYAKLRKVNIYVTVNTLIKDSQLTSALKYIYWLYKHGVDAVIIQDMGLASLCREIIPDLAIHASTQMTIHNVDGVKWAANFGFKRVVLSRELAISEVEKIKNDSRELGIEIEIFGHGALCYSYSGQCLLSSFIGGRSGNRGVCAQPCRKGYQLITGDLDEYGRPVNPEVVDLNNKYLLSTKDLSVYKHLDRVSRLDIDSLKIEGRMRSPEYVAIVIKIYREAFDSIKNGKWKPKSEDVSKLKLAFNRGFTGGYLLKSRNEKVMGRDASGNRGLYIGKIKNYNHKSKTVEVKIENQYKIKKGDGVLFVSPTSSDNKLNRISDDKFGESYKNQGIDESFGMAIETNPKIKGNILVIKLNKPLDIGSKMYLTRSISLNHEASDITNNISKPSIPIDISVKWDTDLYVTLNGEFRGFDGKKYSKNLKSDFKMEKAINKPLNSEKILNQLQKTGETPFKLKKILIDYPGDLFTPISNLNHLRRDFLKLGESLLLNTLKPAENEVLKVKKSLNEFERTFIPSKFKSETAESLVLSAYIDSIECLKGALDGGVKRVYFEPEIAVNNNHLFDFNDGKLSIKALTLISSELKIAVQLCNNADVDFIWKWPQITHDNQIKVYQKILKSDLSIDKIMVDGLGAAESLKSLQSIVSISGSAGLNIWNMKSVQTVSKIFDTLTPSSELSRDDLKALISNSSLNGIKNLFEIVVQGNVDSLISNDYLPLVLPNKMNITFDKFWGIKDPMKQVFPIKLDSSGKTHVLNSVELCLIDHLPELFEMGIEGIVLDLRNKTFAYSKEMSTIYGIGLDYIENENYSIKRINGLKNKIKNISTGGITTGNYLKGVKDVQ